MRPHVERLDRSCEHCATVFAVLPSDAARGRGRFCTTKCMYAFKRIPLEQHTQSKDGYLYNSRVDRLDHLQHREIAIRAIGKPLPVGVCVHHVNGNGTDNRNQNLVICQDAAYHNLLHKRQHVVDLGGDPRIDRYCSACKCLHQICEFGVRRRVQDGLNDICRQANREHAKKYGRDSMRLEQRKRSLSK